MTNEDKYPRHYARALTTRADLRSRVSTESQKPTHVIEQMRSRAARDARTVSNRRLDMCTPAPSRPTHATHIPALAPGEAG